MAQQLKLLQLNHGLTGLVKNASELMSACFTLIRATQRASFPGELSLLSENRKFHQKFRLLVLLPFVFADGLLRVGGRL